MKKLSYILGVLGVILIITAIFLLNTHNNDNNLGWTIEYQKGQITNQNFPEYNADTYKSVNINQNDNYCYIVPQNAYLSSMANDVVEYRNDRMLIMRYNQYLKEDKITDIINSYNSSSGSIEILKKELPNGNIYLLEKIQDQSYIETLNVFVKIDNTYYYRLYYRVYDMRLSEAFINEIMDVSKYQADSSNHINNEGEWQISIDAASKKTFNLKYDSSKYFKSDLDQDYGILLKIDNNIEKMVQLTFIYNNEEIDDKENDLYTISSSKKIKLKDYDCILNTIVYDTGVEFIHYIVIIDNNTKLMVSYNKLLEQEVDINDFLNFTYK